MLKTKDLAISIEGKDREERNQLLERCAATTLNSKLIGGEKEFFSKMVVDAVSMLDEDVRLSMIGVKKVSHRPVATTCERRCREHHLLVAHLQLLWGTVIAAAGGWALRIVAVIRSLV